MIEVIALFVLFGAMAALFACGLVSYLSNEHLSSFASRVPAYHIPTPQPKFSVADYQKRRHELLVDLCTEWKNRNRHIITLWLEPDGLRINEDGSTEWISREKPKIEATPSVPLNTPLTYGYTMDEVASALERLHALDTQQTQWKQNQVLLDNLSSCTNTNPYYQTCCGYSVCNKI